MRSIDLKILVTKLAQHADLLLGIRDPAEIL